MSGYLLVFTIVIWFSLSGFTQFVDRGEYVEVSKGVKLCSNAILDISSRRLDSESRFWRVTSKVRANGTQAVDAFTLESSYDRKSGDTTIEERQYDNYATLFKRAPEHKGMLLMVSPKDGRSRSDSRDLREKEIVCRFRLKCSTWEPGISMSF